MLLIACLVLTGCPHPPVVSWATVRNDELPSDSAALERLAAEWETRGDRVSLENALVVRDKALASQRGLFDLLWKNARAACELADAARGDRDKVREAQFAERARRYAEQAVVADVKRVEGHYYLAEAIGLFADTKTVAAWVVLPEMLRESKAAVAADEKYEHAGPHRLLGALLISAPPWPTSVGDVDEGLEEEKRAVELDSAYPANHLYLGEALLKNNQLAAARKELVGVLVAPAPLGDELRAARWRIHASELLAQIKER